MKLRWHCTMILAALSLQGCAGLDESFAEYEEEQRCAQFAVTASAWDGSKYRKNSVSRGENEAERKAEREWASRMARQVQDRVDGGESPTAVSPVTGVRYRFDKYCVRYRSSPSSSTLSAPAPRTYPNRSVSAPGIK